MGCENNIKAVKKNILWFLETFSIINFNFIIYLWDFNSPCVIFNNLILFERIILVKIIFDSAEPVLIQASFKINIERSWEEDFTIFNSKIFF